LTFSEGKKFQDIWKDMPDAAVASATGSEAQLAHLKAQAISDVTEPARTTYTLRWEG
jgi:hypothetical protein